MQRWIIPLASVAGLSALLLFGLPLIDPVEQLAHKSRDLLEALERADRSELEDLLAEDYRDVWEQDKAAAVENAILASKQFLVLELSPTETTVRLSGQTAQLDLGVRASGKGSATARHIQDKINSLDTPWQLSWRREEWKPWSWRLTGVHHEKAARWRIPKP